MSGWWQRPSGVITALSAAVATLVVAFPTGGSAAQTETETVDITGQSSIVVETWEIPNPPVDPNRCVTVFFIEFPDVPGAQSYAAVFFNQILQTNQMFGAGPSFPGDHYTISSGGQTRTFDVPDGRHRIVVGSNSSGAGCQTTPLVDIVSVTASVEGEDNRPPIAQFTWAAQKDKPLTVDFDASSSTDDHGITSYAWTIGGTPATGVKPPSFTFPEAGTYEVTLKVTDADGLTDTLTQRVSVSDEKGALEVTIKPIKNPVYLGTDFKDNTFDVYVEVRNIGDVPVTGVRVQGALEIGPIQGDEPYKNSQVVDPVPEGIIGDLAPGGPAKDTTYRLEGLRKGISELSVLVTGWDGTQTVTATGRKELELKDEPLVELRVRSTGGPYLAGQGLRLEGSVKNLSKDKKIGVVAIPVPGRYSNAGNGFLHTTDVTRTPDMPQGWLLEPEQELPLKGIVRTFRSAVGGTAEIDYVVKAWVHNEDGSLTSADSQVKKIDTDGYGVPVRIFVSANPPEPDGPNADCGSGTNIFTGVEWGLFTCGLVVGLDNFAAGGVDLLRLLGNGVLTLGDYELRALAWEAQMLATSWRALQGDSAALKALADEIALDVKSLVDAGAITLGQAKDVPAISAAVADALSQGLGTWVDAYAHGDLETLKYQSGVLVGGNPDLAVEGFLRLATLTRRVGAQALLRGFARTEKSVAVTAALEKAAVKTEAEIATAVAKGTDGATLAKQIPTGATLPEGVLRGLGQSSADIGKIQEIAKKKNLLLLFRARSAEAARLLEQGLAWWKPEWIKIKTVNDIDLRFLGGYSRKGTVQFVEPPFKVDLSLPRAQLEAAIKRDAKAFAESLGIEDAELALEVQKRAELRASEWALYHDKFFDGAVPGSFAPGPWQNKGIEVAFDATKQGISPAQANVAKDIRKTRLRPSSGDSAGRRAFDVELQGPRSGPGAGEYRWITGDTDFLAILNADGTPILDVSRRLEIYELLQGAIGMQHGESLTFAVTAEKRAEFLRCCVEGGEAMVAVGPDGVATAARFVESKSILDDTVNRLFHGPQGVGDFTLLFGARQQLKANTVLWNSMTILDVFDVLANALNRYRVFYSPAKFERFVNDLQEDMTRKTFDRRNGAVLQPNGSGGLRRWTPGGASTLRAAGTRSVTATQGGAWSAIGVAQAVALGLPGTIDLVPQTVLTGSAAGSATSIPVAELAELDMSGSSEWFAVGDRIVLDPGGEHEELATVTSVDDDRLGVTALAQEHNDGEMVSVVPEPRPPLVVRKAGAVLRSKTQAVLITLEATLPLAGERLPACRAEPWVIGVGSSSWTVPAARQRSTALTCTATATVGGVTIVGNLSKSGTLVLALASLKGTAIANPLAVSFAVGDLARGAGIRFRERGKTWVYP